MIKLVYVSSANNDLDKQALYELLKQSRDRNKALGITGMLLYVNGNFVQVLEGEQESVEAVYHSILKDERNYGNIVLQKEPIIERVFPKWSMGFRDLSEEKLDKVNGFSEFVNRDLSLKEFASREDETVDLLYSFKKGNTP